MLLISTLRLGLSFLLVQACSAASGSRVTLQQPSNRSSHMNFYKANKVATASLSAISIPRGGGIVPLMSPDVAIKTFLGSYGVNGITGGLTPEWHMKTYLMDIDNYAIFLTQEVTAVDTNIVLLLGLQLLEGMPFEKAVGWSTLPYIGMTMKKLLTGDHDTVGCPAKNGYLVLVINAVVALASIQGHALAGPLIKGYALFSLINAIPMLLAPEKAGEVWDIAPKTFQNKLMLHRYGMSLLGHAVAVGLPAFGIIKDVYKVAGWTVASLTASMVGLLALNKFDKPQIAPASVSAALMAVITTSLLLQ